MKQVTIAVLSLAVCLLAVSSVVQAEEGDSPKSQRWMLKMEHGPLRIVPYRTVDGRTLSYHYMTLKVTNPTELPRDWYPLVKAVTDTKKTYVAVGYDEALEAIRSQESNEKLVPVTKTQGKLAPGKTIDTVAIFGPLDPLYDEVRVQIIGLVDPIAIYKVEKYDVEVDVPGVVYTTTDPDSGETIPIKTGVLISDVAYLGRNKAVVKEMMKEVGEGELPKPTVEYWEVRERRAYEMIYRRPGDEFRPDDDMILKGKEAWQVLGDVRLERQIKM